MKAGQSLKAIERSMTEPQVQRLAAMVKERFGEIGNPLVRAPLPDEYRVGKHWLPKNYHDLSVDIDIGFSTITLCTESKGGAPPSWSDSDLRALSKLIFMHVFLAQGDHAGSAELRQFHTICEEKIARDGSGVSVVSVRFAPALIDRPSRIAGREKWVRLALLDDTLTPTTMLITGRTQRRIRSEVQRAGAEHVRRRKALERLNKSGAILEVEAAAEHAIVAAKRSVGEVARSLFELRQPDSDVGQLMVLWGNAGCHYIGVRARRGRIAFEAELPAFRWASNHELTLLRTLPETVLNALPGRQLRDLIDHPYLLGDAIIDAVPDAGPTQTRMRIRSYPRLIFRNELG